MSKFSISLFLTPLLFWNFQCDDCEDELHDQSSYTAAIIPLLESYFIGDTILVGASFSPLIPLEFTNTTHDNSNQIITFVVQIFEVRPNNGLAVDGIGDFDIFSKTGPIFPSAYYDRRSAIEITNTCDNNKCEFLLEIIPKEKGIYCFNLLNSGFGEHECQYLSFVGNDFGLADNNFKICQEINTSHFRLFESGVYYPDPGAIESFYFFKVD